MRNTAIARTFASVTAALAMGACASGTGGMSGTPDSGTTGTGGSAAVGTTGATTPAPTNTGSVPTTTTATDTSIAAKAPPTGVANSTNGTGTGTASLGTGLSGKSSGAAANSGNTLLSIGSDAHILSAVDVANTDEIAAGMLAREKSTSPRVRSFAQQMVTDHTKMQNMDRELATQAQLTGSDSADVTRTMRQHDDSSMAKLRATPRGPGFDALYISSQIDAHQQTLNLLKATRDQAKDERLRDMIDKAVPQVQSHLDMAKSIEQSLGKGMTPSSTP